MKIRSDKGKPGKRDTSRALFEIEFAGYMTSCYLWKRYTDKHTGYGQLTRMDKTRNAHVWVWEMANGKVPEGLQLDHICRNRACVRPDHLEAVTPRLNVNRGNKTKVTYAQIEEMRALRAQGLSRMRVGAKYGVHPAYVSALVGGVRNAN